MSVSRRNFLNQTLAVGALANVSPLHEFLRAALEAGAQSPSPASSEDTGAHDSYKFWSQFFYPVTRTSRGGKTPAAPLAAPERQAEFIHFDGKTLRYTSDVPKTDLLDYSGDVTVSIKLSQFRPGTGDQKDAQKMKSLQLRLDAIQSEGYRNVLAPLAWTALASLFPEKGGKLPSLESLGFKAPNAMSGTNRILLPRGWGKMAVNVSYMKNDSMLHTVLKGVLMAAKAAAPVLNFPAISVPALQTFTEFYSFLENRATFLLNSPLQDAIATQQALDNPDRDAQHLKLPAGDYILVPYVHTKELSSNFDKLKLEQGYLVEKDASTSDPLEARAEKTAPGVTYASIKVSVNKLEDSGDEGDGGDKDGGEGGGGGGGKHKGGKKSGVEKKPPKG